MATSPNRGEKMESPLAAIVNPTEKKNIQKTKEEWNSFFQRPNSPVFLKRILTSWARGFKHLNCQFSTGGTVRHLGRGFIRKLRKKKKEPVRLILVWKCKMATCFFTRLKARKKKWPSPFACCEKFSNKNLLFVQLLYRFKITLAKRACTYADGESNPNIIRNATGFESY
jgi:hypothetical protein